MKSKLLATLVVAVTFSILAVPAAMAAGDVGADFSGYNSSISSGDSGVVTLTNGSTTDDDKVGTWEAAVNKVDTDDTYNNIYIKAGTYDVTGDIGMISVSDSVTISGAGPDEVTLNEAGANMDSTTLIRVRGAGDVVVKGITVEGLFQRVEQTP